MMKAWRSHQAGGPESLVLEAVPVPEPTGDEILVKIQGVGINFPDGLFLRDHANVYTRPDRIVDARSTRAK